MCLRVCICVYLNVCVCVYEYVCGCVFVCVHLYVCMCVSVCVYECECVCVYVNMHACLYFFFFPSQVYVQVTTRRASLIYSNGCCLKIRNVLFKLPSLNYFALAYSTVTQI